jgi:hypothetical protein
MTDGQISLIWHFIKIQYGDYTKMVASELKKIKNGLSAPKNMSVPILKVIFGQISLI